MVCTSQPAPGHFLPTSRLLRAFVNRGDEVTVVSSPAFGAFVRRCGFDFRPVGSAWLAAEVSPGAFAVGESPTVRPADYSFAATVTRQNATAGAEVLADLKPDLLLREPTEFGVTFAAECAGIPVSTVGIGFFRSGDRLISDGGDFLLELRAHLGLPAAVEDLDRLSRRRYIQTAPPSIETVGGALSTMRTVEPVPAGAPPREPRLLVTLGTLFHRGDLMDRIMAELASVPMPCVLAAGDDHARLAGSAPANVEVRAFTDLATLAAGCTAMVCHGGFGSLLHALVRGMPAVVVPYNADQVWNAERIQRTGSGRHLRWEDLGDGALATAVAEVHSPGPRRAAAAIAGELASFRPADEVAEVLATEPGDDG